VARWALCWLLFIVSMTVGVSRLTNAVVAPSEPPDTHLFVGLDQQPAELGSPECSRATRALVAASDGAATDATVEQRAAFQRAERAVLIACGAA